MFEPIINAGYGNQHKMQQKPIRGLQIDKSHPLARGLVGCWVFNEGSGERVFDSAQGQISNPFYGTPTWVTGKAGRAIDIGTSGDGVHCRYNVLRRRVSGDSLTMAALVKRVTLNNWRTMLCRRMGPTNNDRNYQMMFCANLGSVVQNAFGFGFPTTAGAWNIYSTSNTYTDYNWHLYIVTHTFGDANSTRMCVDGLHVSGAWNYGSGSAIPKVDQNEVYGMRIGSTYGNPTQYLEGLGGQIAAAWVWNRQLVKVSLVTTGSFCYEITALVQNPYCMFEQRWSPKDVAGVAPPEVAAMFASTTTSLWFIKHKTGMFAKV